MSGKFKKQNAQELKQNWLEKKMHLQFVRKYQIKLIRMKLSKAYPKVI